MLSRSVPDTENIKPETGDLLLPTVSKGELWARRLIVPAVVVVLCAGLLTAIEFTSRYRAQVAAAQEQHEAALRAYSIRLATSIDRFDTPAAQQLIDDIARVPRIHKVILRRNNQESLVAGNLQGTPLQRITHPLAITVGESDTRSVGSIMLVTDSKPVFSQLTGDVPVALLTNLTRILILTALGLLVFHYRIGRHLDSLASETRRATAFRSARALAPEHDGEPAQHPGRSIAAVLNEAAAALQTSTPADVRALEQENAALRKALASQQRMATLGAQFGTVVHEVRNPLAVVRASTKLLTLQLKDAHPDLRQLLQRMDDNAERCSQLLELSRDIALGDNTRTEATEINAWLEGYIQQFEPPNGISLRFEPAADAVYCDIEPFKIEQILRNLIENAAHAALSTATSHSVVDPDSSRIDVAISAGDESLVHITVRDRGLGVTSEEAQQLFDPLFTTKPDGMGMGLPISNQIAKLVGGTLTLEPAAVGTLARLTLPTITTPPPRS